jgi:hypothetical protein
MGQVSERYVKKETSGISDISFFLKRRAYNQLCGVQGLGLMPPLAVPKNQGRFGVPYC